VNGSLREFERENFEIFPPMKINNIINGTICFAPKKV
jgi:hypothetical protein